MSKKDIKKNTIIRSAIQVFANQGFRESTISEIAQKANISGGSIYQYFKNKEDLFFSLPVEKTREFCRELELHLQGVDGASGRIRKYLWYYLYFFQTNPNYARILMFELRVSKKFVKTDAYQSLKPFADKILEIIKEGQEEGIIRQNVSIYLIRQLILGVLEHIVTRWLLKGEKYDLIESYDDVYQLIMEGISKPKESS